MKKGVIAGAMVALCCAAAAFYFFAPRPAAGRVTLSGWKHDKGSNVAVFLFPELSGRRGRNNFFYKRRYDVALDVVFRHVDGSSSTGSVRELYFPTQEANEKERTLKTAVTVELPVPNDAVSMSVIKATGVVRDHRDNTLHGAELLYRRGESVWSFEHPGTIDLESVTNMAPLIRMGGN